MGDGDGGGLGRGRGGHMIRRAHIRTLAQRLLQMNGIERAPVPISELAPLIAASRTTGKR